MKSTISTTVFQAITVIFLEMFQTKLDLFLESSANHDLVDFAA